MWELDTTYCRINLKDNGFPPLPFTIWIGKLSDYEMKENRWSENCSLIFKNHRSRCLIQILLGNQTNIKLLLQSLHFTHLAIVTKESWIQTWDDHNDNRSVTRPFILDRLNWNSSNASDRLQMKLWIAHNQSIAIFNHDEYYAPYSTVGNWLLL